MDRRVLYPNKSAARLPYLWSFRIAMVRAGQLLVE